MSNPWKIIGWIVLVLIILFMTTCAGCVYLIGSSTNQAQKISTTPGGNGFAEKSPNYTLKIINVTCDGRKGVATIKNIGTDELSYAKGYFEAYDKSEKVLFAADSFVHPTSLPVGATGTVDAYFPSDQFHSCGLTAIQDSNGIAANLSK